MSNPKYEYKYYFIYKILNLINKKKYIGFHATNKEYDKDDYFGSGDLLKTAIIKYGIKNFVMGVIEYINLNEWSEKEKYWIKEMKSHVSQWGYNQTEGGDGSIGFRWLEESKQKFKKPKSELHKQHLKGKNKNRKQSKETRRKRSDSLKGHIVTAETRNKLKKSNTGKTHTSETKLKIGLSSKGRKQSKETRIKRSKALKGKKHNLKEKTCPYCGLSGKGSNMTRYHFNNCKFKNEIILDIQKLLEKKEPIKNIILKYNISRSTIYKIKIHKI